MALSVGNSCAGNKLIASTSSSVRWVSASNRRRLSISSSKSRGGDKAVRCPAGRDQQRAARPLRHAPSPDRRMPITGAVKLRAQSVAGQPLAFASPAHDHADSYADKRAASDCLPVQVRTPLHRRQLLERGRARRDNFLMRGEAVIR